MVYITDLCESKIAVNAEVQTEMHPLRTEEKLSLSVSLIYEAPQNSIKICFLNARSLHKHIDDIRHDLNYSSADVDIFSETRFSSFDIDDLYLLDNKSYILFRNDCTTTQNV